MKPKDLKFIFEINLGEKEMGFKAVKKLICTDYKLYESILFHIVQNAIKFAKSHTEIKINVEYKSE